MNRESFSICLAVLGLVLMCGVNKAQAGTGMISVVREELPSAKIVVTGKGYSPNRDISPTQKRLLAQRAATVDAYRVLASTVKGISGYVVDGNGYVVTSGFVRGAELSNVRYFANGKVEVDLLLPVSLYSGKNIGKADWDTVIGNISRRGYSVCYTERPVKQIGEQEWLEMRR